MARIRSVKPELRTSEKVASWPFEVRYFWVLLWGYLDDRGRGLDVPKAIAGDCFPHDRAVTAARVDRWLTKIAESERDGTPAPLCRYEVAGRRYLHSTNWREHQRPNRPSPSRLPPCPTHEKLTESLTEPLHEPSLSDSLHGAEEVDSRGAEEQQQPRGEPPPGDRFAAAAAVISKHTDATGDEPHTLAEWINREKRPRNLPALVAALAKGPDLQQMLADHRDRTGRNGVAAEIAQARKGPPCEHGEPGGKHHHPTTGKPLCPLCRVKGDTP